VRWNRVGRKGGDQSKAEVGLNKSAFALQSMVVNAPRLVIVADGEAFNHQREILTKSDLILDTSEQYSVATSM
jgi:hypothetical protein